jgi:hypothetical protein
MNRRFQAKFRKIVIYDRDCDIMPKHFVSSFKREINNLNDECENVATLLVNIPTKCIGGELNVEAPATEVPKTHSFILDDNSAIAFNIDCQHWISKVTQGYRIYLLFDLINKKNSPKTNCNNSILIRDILKTSQLSSRTIPNENYLNFNVKYYSELEKYLNFNDFNQNRIAFLLRNQYNEQTVRYENLIGITKQWSINTLKIT